MKRLWWIFILLIASGAWAQASWEPQTSGTVVNLNGVHFITPDQGLAVGDNGIIRLTTNGGDNWQSVTSGTTVNLNDVSFVDDNAAVAVGQGGTILRSTDGGSSWSPVASGTNFDLLSVSFEPGGNGICGGSAQTILHSSDGGQTWTVVQTDFWGGGFWGAHMLDSDFGAIIGENSIFQPLFAKSVNGGVSWSFFAFYLEDGNVSNEGRAYDVSFATPNVGFAACRVWDGTGVIATTINGGSNWNSSFFAQPFWGISAIDENTAYAVGQGGQIRKTTNQGSSWQAEVSGVSASLNAIHMVGTDVGYVVGDGGLILKRQLDTTDVSGPITEDTTWDDAINVVGDVTVNPGVTLTIEPGVTVTVGSGFRITVEGIIEATGTENAMIEFTGGGSGVIWDRIRLENETEPSTFEYCTFSNAEIGIAAVLGAATISNCHFDDNEKGIETFGIGSTDPPSVLIEDTLIENCLQNGIYIVHHSNTTVNNCEIRQCALSGQARGAIQMSLQSPGQNNPTITNNWIHHNTWQGITAWDLTGQANIAPHVEGNLIEYNLTGMYFLHATGTIHNNVIRHNFVPNEPNSGAGVMLSGPNTQPIMTENEITGNFTGLYIVGDASPNLGDVTNDFPGDDGMNMIYENVDLNGNTWSIYLDMGSSVDVTAENNQWDSTDPATIATTIHDGNDVDGLGFVDFTPIMVTALEDDEPLTTGRDWELHNYPNPFRVSTTIHFSLSSKQTVALQIYDVSGRLVRTLVDATFSAGAHQLTWDGTNDRGEAVNSGVYFYRLRSEDVKANRRMVLLR